MHIRSHLDTIAHTLVEMVFVPEERRTFLEDVTTIQIALDRQPVLRDTLQYETDPKNRRISIQELTKDLHPATRQAVELLGTEQLIGQWPLLVRRIKAWVNRINTSVLVTLETAVPIDSHARSSIMAVLGKRFPGRKILLNEALYPKLIGGLRLRTVDWQYDATILGRLERLQNALID